MALGWVQTTMIPDLEFCRRKRSCLYALPCGSKWLNRNPVFAHFKMEVRSCSISGSPHSADRCALLHALPLAHAKRRTVAIEGCYPAAVIYDDAVAIAARVPGQEDDARCRRMNGGARWSAKVDARVQFPNMENGMIPHPELRCDPTGNRTDEVASKDGR